MQLKIDPKKTIEDLTKGFDWKYVNASYKLPKEKIGKYSYKLFGFDKWVRTDEVEKEVKKQGYELASLREVLEFGNQYPDEQRKNWIFTVEKQAGQFFCAILSVRDGRRSVDVLDCDPDDGFRGSHRVLVRELTLSAKSIGSSGS